MFSDKNVNRVIVLILFFLFEISSCHTDIYV